MFGKSPRVGVLVPSLLTVLAAAVMPAPAVAGWLGFRNDLNGPVVVTVAPAGARAGKSHLLYPGEVSWDSILQAGNRVVVVSDGRNPRRVLGRVAIPCGAKDNVLYSVQVNPAMPTTAKLVPAPRPKGDSGKPPR